MTEEFADFPGKLRPLFKPPAIKILYGGRGGAKSWGDIARALLIEGTRRPLRVLCARETQKSIADSVQYLLKSQIDQLGLSGFYNVLKSEITGSNGEQGGVGEAPVAIEAISVVLGARDARRAD